jgi:carbon-monoxide dehydrogenase large subunit
MAESASLEPAVPAARMAALPKYLGQPIKRREDPRLITGGGSYVDDIRLPGMVYLAFLRSPYGHARLRSVSADAARGAPGVLAVATAADLGDALGQLPADAGLGSYEDAKSPPRHPLATDTVRYVGEPVAAVVAESPAAARDALDLIEADYEPLPAVVDPEKALEEGAPLLYEEFGTNKAHRMVKNAGDYAAAAREADVVVRQRIVNQRVFPTPMEPRGCVAQYEAAAEELTLWSSTQIPHGLRGALAAVLHLPETQIRVIARDVGGGFGAKIEVSAEEALTCHFARQLGRPVKWYEDRRENFQAMIHGRDQVDTVEIAAKRDGTITGMKVTVLADLGGAYNYITAVIANLTPPMVPGVYYVQNVETELIGVFTNKTPVGAYRGAGRPEAAHLIERAMDVLARKLNMDPAELRRKNFIPPDAFPYKTPLGFTYDSGEYAKALDRVLELADYQQLRREQAEARRQGRYLGIGLSVFVEICGFGPWESASVRVTPGAKVQVLTGTSPHGQGHVTTWAQIVADALQVPIEDVVVRHSDTAIVANGVGTFGSRSAPVGGIAVHGAVHKVRDKALRLAAARLEAAPEDVEMLDGSFRVKGVPDKSVSFAQIVARAYAGKVPQGEEPGLEATEFFKPAGETFPFGAHMAVVEVDPDTGKVHLRRYVAVDDCGPVINPMIVDGQIHGGLVQGIAQALLEEVVYDDSGQLLSGTLADYAVPRADDVITFETDRTETLSPLNPIGLKGVGELATIGSSPTIINAVVDALAPFGVTHLDMPATAEKVWRVMQKGAGRAG